MNISFLRNNALTFLNTTFATIICVIAAIIFKSLIAWTFTELGNDKSVYLLYANHLLQFGFMAEPIRSIETGEIYHLFHNGKNSPLYALLAAPLLALNLSYFHTHLIISVSGWILFYTGLAKLSLLFLKYRWLTNIFIIFSGLFLYPHELSAGPKDTLAVAFTLWSIYFCYRFIKMPPKPLTTFLLFLSLSGLFLVKFLYTPLLLVFVVLMLFYILYHFNKRLFIHFVLLLVFFLAEALLLKYLIYEPAKQFYSSSINLISDGTFIARGLYPENLLKTFPFISSSVINTNFWSVQAENFFNKPFDLFTQIFRVIDMGVLGVLIIYLVYYWRKMSTIMLLTLIATTTIAGTVMLASLFTGGFTYKISPGIYTYVIEGRSFIMPMLFIQLLVFHLVFQSTMNSFIKWLVFILIILNVTHNIYFRIKEALNYKERIAAQTTSTPRKKVLIKTLELRRKEKDLALVSSDDLLRRHVSLYQLPTYAFTNQPPSLDWMKNGQPFLIAIPMADSSLLKIFPSHLLQPYDTIQPFILHYYKSNGN